MGNVAREKGIFELLEAFRSFVGKNPEARLTICGSGSASGDVDAFIKRFELQRNIVATGTIRGADKFEQLAAAEVFVLPSYTEGMPNAVLEALAAKCLVLGTPVGAMGAFIKRGFVAPLEIGCSDSIFHAMENMDSLRSAVNPAAIAEDVVSSLV